MNALRRLAAVAVVAALAGCAGTPPAKGDPFEGMNRAVFAFNEKVDEIVLKPVATGYVKVVPELVRTGVDNVLGNIGDLWSAVNQLLQAKPVAAIEMGFRFVVNSTFGLGGLFDIASDAGLERRSEDFGQTLGRWGLGPGPYLVLPFLGPSNIRDAAALPADWKASPSGLLREPRDSNATTAVSLVNTRAKLLSVSRVVDDVALDKYVLVRDGYLARRRNLVYDGDPPEEPESEPEDDAASGAAKDATKK
ncbi:MAG: VacJ family lipoprotein [Burkholderiaceae bacterium]